MTKILRRSLVIFGFLVAMFFLPEAYAPICGLDISASQAGAKVYIDGEYVGETPLVHILYNPGLVKLRVEKEGYVPWEEYVEVPWDEIMEVKVELEPVNAQEEAKAQPEEKGVCGPTALLALAMLPLGIRRRKL